MKSKLVKVARKVLPRSAIKPLEKGYRRGRNSLLRTAYGNPAKGLRIIAVTGTNGKTTTCVMINQMLKSAGYKTALFTTALTEVDGQSQPNLRHTTMPVTAEVMSFFKSSKQAGADFAIMEVTSHGLDQFKLDGTPIEVAVITNLSHEHLDYHGTMERYAAAKARLISDFNPEFVILNRDDQWFKFFAEKARGQLTSFGRDEHSSQRLTDIKSTTEGTKFKLNDLELRIKMPGEFNAYNAAATACVGLALGLKPASIQKGLAALNSVPGRMQEVKAGQPFRIMVDYAVTPDALQKALLSLRPSTKGQLIIVFGATGDRDKSKRPVMGAVAAKYADKVYLTDDETYTEDPEAIRQAVRNGIEQAGAANKMTEIADRRQAIEAAFQAAKAGDTVLLTGIGHQTTRNMGGREEPWSDIEAAEQLAK